MGAKAVLQSRTPLNTFSALDVWLKSMSSYFADAVSWQLVVPTP